MTIVAIRCSSTTANSKVLTQCRLRHRHQEYLAFLRDIEKNVPTS